MSDQSISIHEVTGPEAIRQFAETLGDAGGADYVRLVVPDIHGVLRGKMFPVRSVDPNGEGVAMCILNFLPTGPPANIEELNEVGVGNWIARPVHGPFLLPTSKRRPHGARIAQTLCELFTGEGDPVDVDLRRTARRQLQRLSNHHLELYSGSEFEFRMYKAAKEGQSTREPAHSTKHMFTMENLEPYENFVVELDRRLLDLKIEMYTMHPECGRGQLEIPLRPAWGISYADNSALFKMLVKDTARDHDMEANFMTKDLFNEFCNGAHFNHSVWYKQPPNETRRPTSNAFCNPNRPGQLSDLGRHWLAGLMHHGPALLALCSPTVNCYRRVGSPWAPGANDWGMDNRFAAFRVKVGGNNDTYIESRLPSGPANPYLVLSATVAAGLDGIKRSLEPPKEMEPMGRLPATLEEALEALEKDEVMKKELGERLISWYVTMKKTEVAELQGVDISKEIEADLERERALYQFFF